MILLTNEEKVKRIKEWQECQMVHQLTCIMDNCDVILEPRIKDNGNYVILECPKCKYVQEHIPEFVYYFNCKKMEEQVKKLDWKIYKDEKDI